MFLRPNISIEEIIHNNIEMEKFYLGLLFGYNHNDFENLTAKRL